MNSKPSGVMDAVEILRIDFGFRDRVLVMVEMPDLNTGRHSLVHRGDGIGGWRPGRRRRRNRNAIAREHVQQDDAEPDRKPVLGIVVGSNEGRNNFPVFGWQEHRETILTPL